MRFALVLLIALTFLPSAARAQEVVRLSFDLAAVGSSTSAASAEISPADIVVTGERLRGAVRGDIPPLLQLDERDVAAYGAGTIGELIEALSPQTRSAGGGRPVVLVNGQRIASFAEVQNLPPEAVVRIDILPEEAALRYGYRPDQRVVNLVLRPRFRAVTAEAAHGWSTQGGRQTRRAGINVSRIGEEGRWNVDARYQESEALLESERPVVGGLGRLRTLLPRSRRATLGGSFTRDLFREVPTTLTAHLEAGDTQSLIGPAPGGGEAALRPLRRRSETRAANFGLAMNGELGSWNWLFTGNFDRSRVETRTQSAGGGFDRVRSSSSAGEARILLNGPVAPLPAGDAHATVKLEGGAQAYSSRAAGIGPVEARRLSRTRGLAAASLDLPLTGNGVLDPAGRLSATLDAGVETLSDFGTLHRLGAALRWAPAGWASLIAAIADEEHAPTVHELGDPPLRTLNVRLFDFVRGETVDVERIDGGNPDLLAQRRRSRRLTLSLRPLPRENLALTAAYSSLRLVDPVATLPAPTPEIEAAFPDRFERAPDGRLLRVDARPVNFARAEQEEIRWGINWSMALPAPALPPRPGENVELREIVGPRDRSGRLQLALHHSIRLTDRVLVREGGEWIDLLSGAAGSRPRHEVELQAGLFRNGLGARLDASWRSSREVRGIARPGGGSGRLSYSSLARVDLTLFADLGEQPRIVARAPWTRGMRVTVGIENLFDGRLRVIDESGNVPRGLQPAYLDPTGRAIRISIRKLF